MMEQRNEKKQYREDNLTSMQLFSRGLWFLTGSNEYNIDTLKASRCFERSLKLGGKKALWFVGVLRLVDDLDDKEALLEAFSNTEDGRGYYVAGMFFDFEDRRREGSKQ
jgi:hypothetical protein